MNPAGFSIRRPVTVLMVMLAVLVLGIVGFTQLKVALIPDIDFPVVVVITRYPGTPPQEVEEFVTKPVEEQAALVENLESVSSFSREDLSVVMIEFDWGQDMNWASFNAREKIDPVVERLPDDAHRPIIMKLDPSTVMPVMTINVTGMEDQQRLREIADDQIKPELEKLPGVASADLYGGLQREILVEVNRERLNAYRLSVHQIENALRSENRNLPLGFTTEGEQEYTLRLVGEFDSVGEIPNIAVARRNGHAIRLRDVATVKDTHEEVRSYARVNGEPCVTLSITKESDANTVEVSHAVHEALTELSDRLPPGISTTVTADQAEFIEDALHNLYSVGLEGAVLAVVIIFFFLATVTGTLVAAVSIPLSILAVFVLMYFGDMTLNIITMGGLILAIGRIVDDSVVVLENIYRHTENGEPPVDAAISGTGELAMAIAAVTLATMCVFVPLIFVGGMITQLFTSMALVVIFGLFASLVVALTSVPMMSARFLHYHTTSEQKESPGIMTRILQGFDNAFRALAAWYERAVGWCLDNRAIVIAVATAVFVTSLLLIQLVSFEFFPTMDQGETTLVVETPIGSSVESTNRVAKRIENYILQIPELQSLEVYLGESEGGVSSMRGGGGGGRTANFTIKLVDPDERERSTQDVEQQIRKYLGQFPGLTSRFAQQMGPGGGGFEVMITGDDLDVLSELGQEAKEKIADIQGLHDVRLDWEPGSPEYQVTVDRGKAGELGLTAGSIAATLQTLVRGTEELTKYREHGEEYDITVRAPEAQRDWIDVVRQTNVVSPSGDLVPLTEIATIRSELGPTQISRDQRQRSISIEGTKAPDAALSEIVSASREELETMDFPTGYDYEFAGTEEDRQEAFTGMGVALVMGVLLIYMILASLFESLVHPFTIMLAIPLEVIGVFLALLLAGLDVSIMVMLGILMLTGIVVSNSILLVQMINLLRDRGQPLRQAIIQGGSIRLRPILMTAIATLFAMLPLALALRAGSEMWQPLGITVIGGLTTSTFLTLFVIPVAYSVIEQFGDIVTNLFSRG